MNDSKGDSKSDFAKGDSIKGEFLRYFASDSARCDFSLDFSKGDFAKSCFAQGAKGVLSYFWLCVEY